MEVGGRYFWSASSLRHFLDVAHQLLQNLARTLVGVGRNRREIGVSRGDER
jgi:hypothetical protein